MNRESWLLRIKHRTGISYEGQADSSYNEARMVPPSESRQTTLDSRVEVWPPARTQHYRDYWGTHVLAFDLHERHETLTVTATATVEAHPAEDHLDSTGWDDLRQDAVVDRWCEYLLPTTRSALDDELAERAAALTGQGDGPAGVAIAICDAVRGELTYVPGSTGVATNATEAWHQRSGVCQDFSHLTIGLLRAAGIPARYVSGYLHPDPKAERGQPVVGQSHAWVEWWLGTWRGFDPTNGTAVGERHVVIGRGRDYDDVPPLRGVYAGPPSTAQHVEVAITRLR